MNQHENDNPDLLNTDPHNEYQLYPENNVLGAALGQLFSHSLQKKTMNPTDTICIEDNNKISIVTAPKNVKFLIPSGRSGITSNDSTFGVIEATKRTITHVKDLFPINSELESEAITNNQTKAMTPSSSSNSLTNVSSSDKQYNQEIVKIGSDEIPLLSNDNFNDK